MTASSRGFGRAAGLITPTYSRICADCNFFSARSTISRSRRTYSAAAAAMASPPSSPNQPSSKQLSPTKYPSSSALYALHSGVIISRPPLITPNLTPFDKSFFLYQKRLNERLALPFTRYFYFKKDTPADLDWKVKAKDRNGAAGRDVDGYQAWGREGWNDEVLVSSGSGKNEKRVEEPGYIMETLIKEGRIRAVDSEGMERGSVEVGIEDGRPGQDQEIIEEVKGEESHGQEDTMEGIEAVKVQKHDAGDTLNDRITKADKEKDVRRLDRKLARTLYLVVKRGDGSWGFPSGGLVGKENLHQAAERILIQSLGPNLNTWIVGHAPIAHHIFAPRFDGATNEVMKPGVKTFYLKARVMAGQVDPKGNAFGVSDWKWLTKQEMEKLIAPGLWRGIGGSLGDR